MGRAAEIGAAAAAALHLLCATGLAASYLMARHAYAWSLVSHPAETLRLLLVFVAPIVILVYSFLRRDHEHCSFLKVVLRGMVGLPVGAVLNAFGAIVLGAPLGIGYLKKTIFWSLLMSVFTFVPAACVFGSSRKDWHRILASSKPSEAVDSMISLPAQGALLGAWLGAWPMPLDWERPWQEWPICVSYGAIAGYLVGMVASSILIIVLRRQAHAKGD